MQVEVDAPEPSLIRFNFDRRSLDNAGVEQLLRDIVSSVKELGRKNEELQKSNDELRAALREANERLVRFEQPGAADHALAKQALKMAAQLLASAEEAADSHIRTAKAQSADDYEETARRALELQRESVLLLEKAGEEAQRRRQDADRKALETLTEVRASILSMAEDLDSEETVGRMGTEFGATPAIKREAEAGGAAIAAKPERNGSAAAEQPVPDRLPDLATAMELTASPFDSLAALVDFQRTVRRLPGVVDVTTRAFEKGKLHLTVRYSNALPLMNRLTGLPQYDLQPVSVAPDRVEIHLASGRP